MAAKQVDLSEFQQLARLTNGHKPCPVGDALAVIKDQGERETAEAALATSKETIPTGAIIRWFARRNLEVSVAGVTAHRGGKCKCARDRILNG